MKRQEPKRHPETDNQREKRIRNPKKDKRKQSRKVYEELEELDEYEAELRRLKQQDSLEDYFEEEDL